jgi:hypothetical protein
MSGFASIIAFDQSKTPKLIPTQESSPQTTVIKITTADMPKL